jgi:SAM-dependent methyltransferase
MASRPFLRVVLVGAAVALVVVAIVLVMRPAQAPEQQQAPKDFDPGQFVRGSTRLDAPYVASDYEVVDAMLAMAEVRPDDHVVDLGSGDGRILIAAARSHGARGLGVEIDARRIREANANAQAAGVTHRVSFRQQDLFRTPLGEADVLTLYLTQEVNLRLRPRILAQMRPGTRVVSHDFDMGDWRYDRRQRVGAATIYMWIVPARAGGRYRISADGRSAELVLEQQYQRLSGRVTVGATTSRVEQGWISGDRFRLIANIGDGRRTFEGRIVDGVLESTSPARPWRAVRID